MNNINDISFSQQFVARFTPQQVEEILKNQIEIKYGFFNPEQFLHVANRLDKDRLPFFVYEKQNGEYAIITQVDKNNEFPYWRSSPTAHYGLLKDKCLISAKGVNPNIKIDTEKMKKAYEFVCFFANVKHRIKPYIEYLLPEIQLEEKKHVNLTGIA